MKNWQIEKLTACVAALFASTAAAAGTQVQLSSDVFVEKQIRQPDGSTSLVLEQPKLVTPGDNLVFIVKFKNAGAAPAENFIVTNPVPNAVAFNGTSDGTETVSIDNGENWGLLSALRVKDTEGNLRPAQMADVTHIRWSLNQSLPVGSEGKVIFRGVVR